MLSLSAQASERLHPGLKTSNVVGSYEFSNFPMELERFSRQQTRVEAALLSEDGTWELVYQRVCEDGPQVGKLTCDKIIIAAGHTSEAHMPTFRGSFNFLSRPHIVIRWSGRGPSWVWRPIYPFGMKLETILGAWLVWASWAALDFFTVAATGCGDPRLRMLRPWTSIFWMGDSLSIHNYETDWFECVRKGQIVVHHADVTPLAGTTAQLSDGSSLKADVVVCCTSWKCTPPTKEAPYQLYRFLVLASPRFIRLRNVAFIAMPCSVHGVIVVQAQALRLTLLYREAVLHAEYERLRRPRGSRGSGASFPDLVFDNVPYTDLLWGDFGLRTIGKRTLWANIVQPHLPAYYRGLL
ncbi:hypothetical protein F4823DRAFT_641320 [Ustulina deusta]|nr:hypothetical protein F4823DRAFT_641320 [Ustulina deusta]